MSGNPEVSSTWDVAGSYKSEKCAEVLLYVAVSVIRKLTCDTSILFESWYTKSVLILSCHQLLGRLSRGSPLRKPRIVHRSTPRGRPRWRAADHTRTKDCRGVLWHALLLGDVISSVWSVRFLMPGSDGVTQPGQVRCIKALGTMFAICTT